MPIRYCPRALLVVLGLALGALPTPGAAQDPVADFYRGKQVSILVGFTPGGSSSLYAQALARHMGRYLPGSPSFIVQHVPGAGGLLLANNVANTVPRDGTAFAITGRTAAIEPLLGNKNAKFDGRHFNWLGTANVEYTTCSLWHTAKAKTLQDAMRIETVVGGSGADATEVIFPKAANKLTGTKFKVVLGYHGSTEILLAMERGEVEGFCGIGWTFLKLRKADWLKDKKINILYQMSLEKHPELPHVPAIIDYARTPDDRKVFEFLFAPQEMGRPFFAPPAVPAERIKALRDAFARTFKDAAFLAEAEKMGVEVQHVGGEQIQALVERIYASPPDVIARAKAVAE
ncbi:MAG: tripartite tricarboxylate transporter substrate-binding protein [Xanthobacteraceae bacterium]|jgi:tripartite-type tricarboxylate transporter receptor subunit TctC